MCLASSLMQPLPLAPLRVTAVSEAREQDLQGVRKTDIKTLGCCCRRDAPGQSAAGKGKRRGRAATSAAGPAEAPPKPALSAKARKRQAKVVRT